MTPNIGIRQMNSKVGPFNNTKYTQNTFRAKHDGISSKLITKEWGVTLYMITPRGQIAKFGQKITPNIGIMLITSQF